MVSLDGIQKAAELIKGSVLRTPLIYSPTFSKMTGVEVYLKLENLQKGGSFKIRGATYKILTKRDQLGTGIVAASIGNHAQGVAMAARAEGIPATIVMPVWTSITKQEATREYGAEVVLKGQTLMESLQIAARMAASSGKTFIHPYDDPDLITGQGTVGLEILEDLPDVDAIIVPVGAAVSSAELPLPPRPSGLGSGSSGFRPKRVPQLTWPSEKASHQSSRRRAPSQMPSWLLRWVMQTSRSSKKKLMRSSL